MGKEGEKGGGGWGGWGNLLCRLKEGILQLLFIWRRVEYWMVG